MRWLRILLLVVGVSSVSGGSVMAQGYYSYPRYYYPGYSYRTPGYYGGYSYYQPWGGYGYGANNLGGFYGVPGLSGSARIPTYMGGW